MAGEAMQVIDSIRDILTNPYHIPYIIGGSLATLMIEYLWLRYPDSRDGIKSLYQIPLGICTTVCMVAYHNYVYNGIRDLPHQIGHSCTPIVLSLAIGELIRNYVFPLIYRGYHKIRDFFEGCKNTKPIISINESNREE